MAKGVSMPHVEAQNWRTILELEKSGLASVAKERVEQIERHGYDRGHDDEHPPIHLIDAADAYLTQAQTFYAKQNGKDWEFSPADFWPWDLASFKPAADVRSNLVKAAALLRAAIDRIDAKAKTVG